MTQNRYHPINHGSEGNPAQTTTLEQIGGETKFQALLESAPDAIVIVDASGRIAIVNRQAEHLFGYQRDELIDQPVEILLPDRLREIHQSHRSRYIHHPATRPMGVGLDLVARRRDGNEFPVEISLSPLETADGMLVTAVIRDISERQRTEAALRESEERFHTAFTASPAAVSISTLEDERFLDVNDSFLALTGYTRAEVIGTTAPSLGLWLDSDLRSHVVHMLTSQQSIRGIEFELRTKNDGTRLVLASFETIELGGAACILAMYQDITARKQAEAHLEREVRRRTAHLDALLRFSEHLLPARRLDEVLQHAITHALELVPEADSVALYLYDAENDVLSLRASTGFDHLPPMTVPPQVGLVGGAFTTRTPQIASSADEYRALLPPSTKIEELPLVRALDQRTPPSGVAVIPLLTGTTAVGVLALLRKTGDGPFATESRATLEGLANLTVAAIMEDRRRTEASTLSRQLLGLQEQQRALTERLTQAEAAMLQAARLAAVGQLAAAIAHEINNPLYAARNALFLLGEDLPDDLRASPYLQLTTDQLARIAGIIERMRDFYRPDRGELAPCAINMLVEETLALAGLNLQHGAIKMVFTPAPDIPPVLGNADQLRQVFLNLVLNAIEAMPDGGTLTVRTLAQGTLVVIEIQDTGIGIPDEVRPHLFEPFWTSKSNGTGLGLSISAHIVTQHGGQIMVDSAIGEGSTFRIVLPQHGPT